MLKVFFDLLLQLFELAETLVDGSELKQDFCHSESHFLDGDVGGVKLFLGHLQAAFEKFVGLLKSAPHFVKNAVREVDDPVYWVVVAQTRKDLHCASEILLSCFSLID